MKKCLLLIAVLLFPLTAAAQGFNGWYAGGYLGQAWGEDKGTGYDTDDGLKNGWGQKASPKGTQFGLMGGYNWTVNNTLLGLEADYEGRGGSHDRSFQKQDGVTDTDYAVSTKLTSAASLRGRVGYFVTPKVMVYGTAGLATVRVRRSYELTFINNEQSISNWQNGWVAGAGLEYAVTGNVSARFEYRYSDYGTKKVNVNTWDEFYKQHLTEQSVRLGVSYMF